MSSFKLAIAAKKYSSWSLRPWVLLRGLDIPFTEVCVEIAGGANGSPNPALLAISPSGLVPCLGTSEGPIWDSLAISEYLYEVDSRVWPADKVARAFARCMSAEMHSGFPDVRGTLSMNIAYILPNPLPVEPGSRLDSQLKRIAALWVEARTRFGIPSGQGPFLFGAFCAADAMYCPVAFRFKTYGIRLEDPIAEAYAQAILAHPAAKEWEAAALVEPTTIEAYDAHVEKLGGVRR